MEIVKIPEPFKCYKYLTHFSVFLGGSTAGGEWRDDFIKELEGGNILLLNPTRDDWYNNKESKEHMDWKFSAMENCDLIIFYFRAGTMSPVSLLDLGLNSKSKKVVVFCEEGFLFKINVDAVCKTFNIPQVYSFEELALFIKKVYNESVNKG